MAKIISRGDIHLKMNAMTNKPVPFREIEKHLANLVQAEERLDFKTGQVIFYEGHQPYGVYVLRKGRVRLFQRPEEGDEKLIQIIEAGYVFGEESFLEDKPYEFSAKAETDISVSFFSRTVFGCE